MLKEYADSLPQQARQGVQRYDLESLQLMAINELRERLEKDCIEIDGLMNPAKAISCLNDLQRENCPQAYETEVAMVQRIKNEAQ